MTVPAKRVPVTKTRANLRQTLEEILTIARDPHAFARSQGCEEGGAIPYALGWIHSVAQHALGAKDPTDGWLVMRQPENAPEQAAATTASNVS